MPLIIKLTLFFLAGFTCTQVRADYSKRNEFKDSLVELIGKRKDQTFFNDLIDVVNNDGRLTKVDRAELIDLSMERTSTLGFELIATRYRYFKAIQRTIEGDYSAAVKLIQSTISTFENEDSIYIIHTYNTMGDIIGRMGDTKLAVSYLEKAFELTEKYNFEENHRVSQNVNNHLVLGNTYFRDGQFALAEHHFLMADSLSNRDLVDEKAKGFCLLNLAKIYIHNTNYSEAIDLSNQAISLSKEHGHVDIEAYGFLRIGIAQSKLRDYNAALKYFERAEEVGRKNELNFIVLETIKQRSELYDQQGEFRKSRDELREYLKVKEKLEETNKTARAAYLISQTKKEEQEKLRKYQEEERNKRNKLLLIFSLVAGLLLVFFVMLWVSSKQRKLVKKEKLEKLIIAGQLKSLSAQMNPHFIFNSLNSIQDLVLKQDAHKAYDYIGKFALLIRKILQHSEQEFIDIEEEFNILRLYLELEFLRFKKDFNYSIEHNDITGVEIPPMLIQPFVENAIKHGLLHKEGGKELVIDFDLQASTLVCTVTDNGVGRERAREIISRKKNQHPSFSGQSMSKRLHILQKQYGGSLGFVTEDLANDKEEPTGTKVVITIPCKRRF